MTVCADHGNPGFAKIFQMHLVGNTVPRHAEMNAISGTVITSYSIHYTKLYEDHTLLQDATGTMAMLEFEALGLDRVRADLAAQYVDHNLRITSYNVCYTKLLRSLQDRPEIKGGGAQAQDFRQSCHLQKAQMPHLS